MPFRSKAQQRFMFAAEDRGDLPQGMAEEWAKETPSIKRLPERVKNKGRTKKAALRTAFEVGFSCALKEVGLEKRADFLGKTLSRTKHMWIPGAAGAVVAGPEHRTEGALLGLGGGALARHYGLKALSKLTFSPEEFKLMKELGSARKLQKNAPDLFKQLNEYNAQKPMYALAAGALGGAGAGYAAREALKPGGFAGPPVLPSNPAVSDMATHYSGLVPGEEYYI